MSQIEGNKERVREKHGGVGQWESGEEEEEEEEGEARSRYSNGRSYPWFLRGQKFTVVLISPFRSQSEHVFRGRGNFDPLRESDCKDLKLTSTSTSTIFFSPLYTFFFFIPIFSSPPPPHVYLPLVTEDKKKEKTVVDLRG